MKFDNYSLFARALPALLTSVPFFVFHYYFLKLTIGDFWNSLLALEIATDVTFSVALLFLLIHVNRIVAKEFIEKKLYKNGLNYPTTNYLLHLDDNYSSEYTKMVHQKIKKDFGIDVPTLKVESLDNLTSRKIISEAMNHVRFQVKKGVLVGQHNIEYGFIRNFAGGNIVAATMSALNIIIFSWIYRVESAIWISLATLLIYGILSLLSKKLVDNVGCAYARVLIQEFMAG